MVQKSGPRACSKNGASSDQTPTPGPGSPAKKGKVYNIRTAILSVGFIRTNLNKDPQPNQPVAIYADLEYKDTNPFDQGPDTRGPNCGEPRYGADTKWDPDENPNDPDPTVLKAFE